MGAAQEAVDFAASLKGNTREKIVDIYNSYTPRARGYKVKYEDYLCATFMSSIFIAKKWTEYVPPECGAHQLYNNMAAIGRGVIDRNRIPNVGDLIFFGGKIAASIAHVGIVESVKDRLIYYYDVNATVARHICVIGSSYITGYGMPDYDAIDKNTHKNEPETAVKAGDLVHIRDGAKWYKGQSIKASVFDNDWYVLQISGDRAVLGMNASGTRNIQSPIHISDIYLVSAYGSEAGSKDETVDISATIKSKTLEKIKEMAETLSKTVGEVIDDIIASMN